jgi:hypothetical protein
MTVLEDYKAEEALLIAKWEAIFPNGQTEDKVALTAAREIEYWMFRQGEGNIFLDHELPAVYNDPNLKPRYLNAARALLVTAYTSGEADFITTAKQHLTNTLTI